LSRSAVRDVAQQPRSDTEGKKCFIFPLCFPIRLVQAAHRIAGQCPMKALYTQERMDIPIQ
jgi:hypothetical protein